MWPATRFVILHDRQVNVEVSKDLGRNRHNYLLFTNHGYKQNRLPNADTGVQKMSRERTPSRQKVKQPKETEAPSVGYPSERSTHSIKFDFRVTTECKMTRD